MKKLILLCSTAFVLPTAAFAQSTGTEATEKTIVITGTRTQGVGGTVVPDVPKTRSVLTQDFIARQAEGQSVLAIVSNIPGVNFTNTDPYGGGNGNLRIRGFPGNRVAFLWDGLPLNDTGNYAIFGGQQMSNELIDQVSVNLGTTDVDSPTPSAAGGVISYRTRVPGRDMALTAKGSYGTFDFKRAFIMADTGEFTSMGTRAFLAFERSNNLKFKGPGENDKFQINGRVYQPIGSNGDFLSLAAHHNRNRNHQYNSGTARDYKTDRMFDNIEECARDTPTTGVRDNDNSTSTSVSSVDNLAPNTCTNYYGLRLNPSNTQNVRGAMKLTLAENLTLTADPSYFWTIANGGGTILVGENDSRLRVGSTVGGVDLNDDNDILDINTSTSTSAPNPGGIRVYSPSNTRTKRFTFLSSLIWSATEQHRFRVAYTFDRGRHRQTGAYGRIDRQGDPYNWFGGYYDGFEAVEGVDGEKLQSRNRLSYATLNQLSGEYFGQFLDKKLKVVLGVRAPFFQRDLNQYCYTSNGTNFFGGTTIGGSDSVRASQGAFRVTAGNPYCTSDPNPVLPGGTLANPTAGEGTRYFAPFERKVKYSPILPSAGVSYDFLGGHSVYASYGKNFSSPSTDSLYRSVVLNPEPEFTNSYEGGYRYRTGRLQAQIAGYRTDYSNRIVSAQDLDPDSPTFGSTVDRNAGTGRAWGIDGQVSFKPEPQTTLYTYGSYTNTKIDESIFRVATVPSTGTSPCPSGVPVGGTCEVVDIFTEGAEFVETPKWQFGGRAQRAFGPLSIGFQGKYVGKRWSTDDNGRTLATSTSGGQTAGQPFILTDAAGLPIAGVPVSRNGRTNAYTLFDVDAVLDLKVVGLDKSKLRVAVQNLFDKYYFGNISTQSTLSGSPRYSVGGPRTIQATLTLGY